MKIDCVDIDEYSVENPDRMDEIKKMCNNKMDFCKKPQYLLWWLELLLNKCSSFKNYKCKAGIEASPDDLNYISVIQVIISSLTGGVFFPLIICIFKKIFGKIRDFLIKKKIIQI